MNRKDGLPAITFLGIGLIALIAVCRLPIGTITAPDAAFFPMLLGSLLVLLSLVLMGRSVKVKFSKQGRVSENRWKKLILAAAGLVAYAFFLKPVGYVVCTVLVLILFAKMGSCSWKVALTVSVLCTLLSYVVFRWYLQSPLPQGVIPF